MSRQDGAAVLDAIVAWEADRRVRLRRHLGRAGPLRPRRLRHGLGSRCGFNTGDCAHEPHIRHLVSVGSRDTVTRGGPSSAVPGSHFVDGIGSTEMGHSAVPHHPPGGHRPLRAFAWASRTCSPTWRSWICRPGAEVPVGAVGHFGLKSPHPGPRLLERLGQHVQEPVPGLLPDRRPDVPRRGRLLLPRRPGGGRGSTSAAGTGSTPRCPRRGSCGPARDVRDCTGRIGGRRRERRHRRAARPARGGRPRDRPDGTRYAAR